MASFFKKLGKLAGGLAKNPLVKMAAGIVPGGGAIMQGIDIGSSFMGAAGGGGGGKKAAGLPSFAGASGGLPALPAGGGQSFGLPVVAGNSSAARSLSRAPLMNMQILQQLGAAGLTIPFAQLKPMYRSPRKGYVIVHPPLEGGGVANIAMDKRLAIRWGLYNPPSKPPISAGDWNSIRRANRVVKKVQWMNKMVKKVANFGTKRAPSNAIPFGGKRRKAA